MKPDWFGAIEWSTILFCKLTKYYSLLNSVLLPLQNDRIVWFGLFVIFLIFTPFVETWFRIYKSDHPASRKDGV